ncbi:soluble scavenger receptor cysteine-rich domain-containing protein SSC5D-like [Sebastes umbrosus]|uniref:soluble scavenger receptor cysteine-rich domain-containing protein SSC5D-like n=1 Tax=Sebastes umbrosus TaxID=72105 RepID=UPI00189FF81F|nr:soluble scavenger receptor cysteine-rich domain-containing protein SSC5D-like [Sebastes umbrosus]
MDHLLLLWSSGCRPDEANQQHETHLGQHTQSRETVYLDIMDHLLVLLLLLLWSSGLQAEENHNSTESVRLVGGDSRCAGTLELKHQRGWRPVDGRYSGWTLKEAAAACRDLDCGSAVSVEQRKESSVRSVWLIRSVCVQSGYTLRECATSDSSSSILNLTCSGVPSANQQPA